MIRLESTFCNYSKFEFKKIWSENPRVAPQPHSIRFLGTIWKKDIKPSP